MTPIILDASAALSLLIAPQSTAASDSFFSRRTEWLFLAPYVFEWEVRNILVQRRKRVAEEIYTTSLDLLDELNVAGQAPVPLERLPSLARTAEMFGLSLFDAAYLALAIETECPVASRDAALLNAVRAHDLTIHDLR